MSQVKSKEPNRKVLIATRNPVFDPWIGTIERQLELKQFEIKKLYFSNSMIKEGTKKEKFYETPGKWLRSVINFVGVANVEGSPYLYATDWNKEFANRIRENQVISKFVTSLPVQFINRILIKLYRIFGSRVSIEVENLLNNLNAKPGLCIAMPTNMPGSMEHEVISWSNKENIPSIVPVMTLDNLSSKGILLDLPTFVACWNETQRRYLRKFHNVPESCILFSKSLFFSAWQRKFALNPPKFNETDSLKFLYVCSSARIAGYSRSPNDRAEETKTLCKLIEHLDAYLKSNSRSGCLRIRTHPTFTLDPLILKLRTLNLRVEVAKGVFPDFNSEEESLVNDLYNSNYCFGMNTSAMLQASLLGIKTFAVVTRSNEVITSKTPHLEQLISNAIIRVWKIEEEDFGDINVNFGVDSHQAAKDFVGLGNSDLADQIFDLLDSKL